jgi:hypothetical protein
MGTLEDGGVMKQEAWAQLCELPDRKENAVERNLPDARQ